MVQIAAEWALYSKRPGSRADYTVLSCSDGRLRSAHFQRILDRFEPGTPDADMAVPRVTLSVVDVEQAPYVGIAIQTKSEDNDGTGRRIYPTSYFCLPYETLRTAPVSYRALYTAFLAACEKFQLPTQGSGELVEVQAAEFDPATIADDLQLFGEQGLRTAAALLLNSNARVCITQSEHTSLDERLRVIDAVTAMLPYGYRAKITATTWANSTMEHKLRLFFARSSKVIDTTLLPWQGTAAIPNRNRRQLDYFTLLSEILAQHGSTEVVKALAADTDVRNFTEPELAVQALQQVAKSLDRHNRPHGGRSRLSGLTERLSGRRGDPDFVESSPDFVVGDPDLVAGHPDFVAGDPDFVAGDRRGSVGQDPDASLNVVFRLVQLATPHNLRLVEQQIPGLPAKQLTRLLNPLQDMARSMLWSETDVRLQVLVDLLSVSADAHLVDSFVSGLIGPPPDAEDLECGLSAAAGLLMHTMIADPPAYPRTAEALGENVPVALELLAQLSASQEEHHRRAGQDQVWSCLPLPLVHPLQIIVGDRQAEVGPEEIEEYARYGRSCVRALLEIACNHRRLDRVIIAFLGWLRTRGGFPADDRAYWQNRLSGLDTDDFEIQGILDVLMLMAGARPKWMTHAAPEGWPDYQFAFDRTWHMGWPNSRRMTSLLADHLREVTWYEYADRADNVLDLIETLFPHGDRDINKAMEHGLAACPDLGQSPRAERWLAHRRPDHRSAGAVKVIATDTVASATGAPGLATASDDPVNWLDKAFAYVEEAMEYNCPPEEIFAHLAKAGYFADPTLACSIVARLPQVVSLRISLHIGQIWADQLADSLCTGKYGAATAAGFTRQYVASIADELRKRIVRLQQIDRLTGRNWQDDVTTVTDLKRHARQLDALTKVDHRGGGRRMWPRLGWGIGPSENPGERYGAGTEPPR